MNTLRILTIVLGSVALCAALSARAAPIHDAAREGKVDEAGKLIAADPKLVNTRNELGSTPLHVAAGNATPDLARLLLDKGAEINAKDNNGATPLHIAAFTGRKDTVEFLLARGADVHAKDNQGRTARDFAESSLSREISAILVIRMLAVPAPAPKK